MDNKKILFVVNVDWFFISHRLPLAIEALRRSYKVIIITRDTGHFDELQRMGIQCIDLNFDRLSRHPLRELGILLQLCKHYFKIQPDIIHQITLKQSIYGSLAAKIFSKRSRVINAVTGLGYVFVNERNSFSKTMLIALMRFSFSRLKSNFIFQNPDDRDFYHRLGFLNATNHIIVKGAGVDENHYRPIQKADKKGKIKVALVARMLKDKGVLEFVNAARRLRGEFHDTVEFLLVGGVDLANPASLKESDLNSLAEPPYITWLGHVADVKQLYKIIDIACLPSYREGLPKSLIEAMAMGCPIITTDAIGCKECVDEGVNGYLVPVGDEIILADRMRRLILDSTLRTEMGLKSREKMVLEMSLSKVLKKTFDFYNG